MTTQKEQKIINAQSMNSSFESAQISILPFIGYSIQFVTTGTATGILRIFTSNDEEGVSAANSSWDELEGAEFNAPLASSMTISVERAFYGKIKIGYTSASGTGNMTAKLIGKD